MQRGGSTPEEVKSVLMIVNCFEASEVCSAYPISNHSYVSLCILWYSRHNASSLRFSFTACLSVAVPYSSVPQMYKVVLFLVPTDRCCLESRCDSENPGVTYGYNCFKSENDPKTLQEETHTD